MFDSRHPRQCVQVIFDSHSSVEGFTHSAAPYWTRVLVVLRENFHTASLVLLWAKPLRRSNTRPDILGALAMMGRGLT